MNLKEIKELVDLITEKGITEFELERSGVRVHIKRGVPAATMVAPAGGAPPPVFHAPPALPAAETPYAAPERAERAAEKGADRV